jgi:hypothetical protein
MAKPAYNSGAYQAERRRLLAGNPPCIHHGPKCSGTATEADHVPPLSQHDHIPGTNCCVLAPSCGPCAREQGGRLGGFGTLPKVVATKIEEPDPVPFEAFDVPWLTDLLEVPDNATWPRLMTAPHPLAVGSYGDMVDAWSLKERGRDLRWWRRLSSRRLLEHDAEGMLLWGVAVLTVARQVGKTTWLGDTCGWRLHSGAFFDAEQVVLSTGKDVAVVKEMQRPHRLKAKHDKNRYHTRETNGQEEIELLGDGSRWMVRAKDSVYGITASMATVDEAWKVMASVVDDGIEPTTVEALDAQILLVSTAHRRATALMVGRRARALDHLRDGDGPLLLEWSAPPNSELDDRQAWRQASPHWSPKRERLIAARLEGALAGESDDVDEPDPISSFRTQWLNQWPPKRLAVLKGEPLVEFEEWEALRGDVIDAEKIIVAVEDHAGLGAGITAVCIQADGKIGLDAWTCATWAGALTDLRQIYKTHETVKLFAGASILVRLPPGMRATPGTSTLTRATLPLMRELIHGGEIVHDSAELDEQIETVRVSEAIGGLTAITGVRSDLIRAASWALSAAYRPKRTPKIN